MFVVDLSEMEKGQYAIGDFRINAQNLNFSNSYVDANIIKQIGRNIYSHHRESLSSDLGYRSWHQLRKAQVLIAEAEVDKFRELNPNQTFVKLHKDSPISKNTGVQYYINKRYLHYFEPTEGVEIGSMARSFLGDTETAKTIVSMVRMLHSITKYMKVFILRAHPSTYISSAIGSSIIYAIHKRGGTSMLNDFSTAYHAIDDFRNIVQEYAKEYTKDPKSKATADAKKVMDESLIGKAMAGGLVSTIQGDLYAAGTNAEVDMYHALRKATGSHQHANNLKTLALDPSTGGIAEGIGKAFDYTELVPKIALFRNLIENGMPIDLAIQKTMMAFPAYYNLGPNLSVLNEFSPYLKFFASQPRMLMYAMDQSPKRLAATAMVAHYGPAATFAMSTDEEKKVWKNEIENGYVKIPLMDAAILATEWFPMFPGSNPYSSGIFNFGFGLETVSQLDKLSAYLPGKELKEVK
jgi:hypothetical protein